MTRIEKYVRAYLVDELEEVQNSPIVNVPNGLTVFEKTLVYDYTKNGYENINNELRSGSGSALEVIKLLERVLRKLPNHEGVVHRTAHLTQKQLQGYRSAMRSGKLVNEPSFISTSKSPLIARMMPRFNVKFQIISKGGKLIEDMSYMGVHTPPNEEEVLFCPGSKFEILNVTDLGRYVLIKTEEI